MSRALTSTEYRLLIQHSPVMIWRSALDANCDYFNETWLAYTAELWSKRWAKAWPRAFTLTTCSVVSLTTLTTSAGAKRSKWSTAFAAMMAKTVGSSTAVFLLDDAGSFAGFIGSCVDVDEPRRAQDAQQQHNQEQLALARDFERWFWRSSATRFAIRSARFLFAARRLQDVADPTGVAKKHADIVERGVHRIQHIVGDLLDLAREREGAGIPIEPKLEIPRSRSIARWMAPALGMNIGFSKRFRIWRPMPFATARRALPSDCG